MILQAIERVATWLRDGTNGVNALLAGVPLIGGDATPPNVTIYDERQHAAATRGQFERTATFPVLLVQLDQDVLFDVSLEQGVRDAPELPLLIAYAVKNQDSALAGRQSYYTMVAVERSLRRLFTVGQVSDRTSGTVSLVTPKGLQHVKLFTPLGDAMVTTAIQYRCYVRDTSP